MSGWYLAVSVCLSFASVLTPGTGADTAGWATASGAWLCAAYLAKRDEEGK